MTCVSETIFKQSYVFNRPSSASDWGCPSRWSPISRITRAIWCLGRHHCHVNLTPPSLRGVWHYARQHRRQARLKSPTSLATSFSEEVRVLSTQGGVAHTVLALDNAVVGVVLGSSCIFTVSIHLFSSDRRTRANLIFAGRARPNLA